MRKLQKKALKLMIQSETVPYGFFTEENNSKPSVHCKDSINLEICQTFFESKSSCDILSQTMIKVP